MKALAAWQNFYMIVGSSAGALVGLQFVVLSLIASRPGVRLDPQTGGTFSTPTIIFFSVVLTLSAILAAPWEAIEAPAYIYGAVGLAGPRTPPLLLEGYAGKARTGPNLKTGCFMPYFPSWPTAF